MKSFGPDFYNITELLTEEELMIQKTAYEFVQTEFMPIVGEHYEKGTFPLELATKLGELGFLGSALPIEFGGSGVSNVAYGLILHELERGDSGLRSFASVQGSLVMYPIYAYGSEEQKEKYLNAFKDYFINSYANKLDQYSGEKIAIIDSEEAGKYVIVNSNIVREGTDTLKINLKWRLLNRDGQIKIIDLNIEGISLIIAQREEFQSFLANNNL